MKLWTKLHIKLGKLVLAVLALLLIGGQAWGASWTVPGDAATPQALFDDNALSDGDSLTFTGDFATLDLSSVAETGTFYISGNFTIGTITGKAGLSLMGNGTTIRQSSITLGANANLQGFRFEYAASVVAGFPYTFPITF